MARPISLELPPRDAREALYSRLQNAPVEHAEAVLAAYDVLQGFHDRGVLELLRGALGSSAKVLEIVVEAIRTPESIRGIRNFLVLVKLLGTIDPELVEGFARSLPEAVALTKAYEAKPLGFWRLLNQFRSKDFRRGLVLINSLLETFGKNLPPEEHHP
jgi:uncharacterized protein YjgD (DUF1641 family)